MEVGQLDSRRMRVEELGHAHRLEAVVRLQAPVERPQEIIPVVRVLLPGVLAVEDDRGEIRSTIVGQSVAGAFELRDHVADCVLRLHVAVHEPDPVAELAVAEDDGRAVRQAVRPVQERRLDQRADLVAPHLDPGGSSEDSFVRGEPLESRLADDVRRLGRHGALGRPYPARFHPECALVRGHRLLELKGRVVGIRERLVRELRVRIRTKGRSVVDDERQDRVVVGRGQDLDLTVALQSVIEVRYPGGHEALAADHVAHVFPGEARALVGKLEETLIRADVVRIDPREVEPEGEVDEVLV